MLVHLYEADPSGQGTPGISGNRDGPSNSASSGVSTGSIITGLTGSTTLAAAVSGTNGIAGTITSSMNMLTFKEAKKPELDCHQQEQSVFLITLLTSCKARQSVHPFPQL